MRNLNLKKVYLYIFINIAIISSAGLVYSSLPVNYVTFEGEDYIHSAEVQAGYLFKLSENSTDAKAVKQANVTSLDAQAKLFGLIPFKEVKIDVLPTQSVIPCGNVIGVKLFTDGLLVLDVANFTTQKGSVSPAGDAGIKSGDIIISANKNRLSSIEQLESILKNIGENPVDLNILRDGNEFTISITPRCKSDDNEYKIGALVRDSTAGIGTLTFYKAENNAFAALGHGIMDSDTGKTYKISSGSIQAASIAGISKGERGSPGELKGVFLEDSNGMGTIVSNTNEGIYGVINFSDFLPKSSPIKVASRSQVYEGDASILCTIDNNSIKEYSVKIVKVMPTSGKSSKGMIVGITDKRLLDKTGGIVQGMSGSPIIQNGRLIGAVTHVFINDPTRGYGIFIDNMLKNT